MPIENVFPTLAKNARVGHPHCGGCEKVGHPPPRSARTQWFEMMARLLKAAMYSLFSLTHFCAGQNASCLPSLHYMGALRRPTATERRAIGKPAAIRADIALGSNDRLLIYETAANEPKAEFKVISGEQQVLYLVLADMPGVNHDRVFGEGLRQLGLLDCVTGERTLSLLPLVREQQVNRSSSWRSSVKAATMRISICRFQQKDGWRSSGVSRTSLFCGRYLKANLRTSVYPTTK